MPVQLAQVPIGEKFNPPEFIEKGPGLSTFVSIILSNAVIVGAVIFFLLILVGGLAIIAGAGASEPEKVAQGQKAVTAALAGFLIIFTAFWIIRIVEIITGVSILNGQ